MQFQEVYVIYEFLQQIYNGILSVIAIPGSVQVPTDEVARHVRLLEHGVEME
jgi:hypothetical protein